MRRKELQITDIDDIFSVIECCNVVHVAMVDSSGAPYVAALNFGFDRKGNDLILYLHSAAEGKKIDILKKNPNVWFQMDCKNELVPGSPGRPCSYSWNYESIMGSGYVTFLTEKAQQEHALNRIIQCVAEPAGQFEFPAQMLERTCVWQIVSKDFTGKRHI